MHNFRFELATHSQYICHTCYSSVKTGSIVFPFPGGYICANCLTQMSDIYKSWYDSQERIDLEEEYNNKKNEKDLIKDVYQAVTKKLKKSLKHLPIVSEYIPTNYAQGTVISLRTDEKEMHKHEYMIYAAIFISKESTDIYLVKPWVSLVHINMIDGKPKKGISSSHVLAHATLDNGSWARQDLETVETLHIADPECFDKAMQFMETQATLLSTEMKNKNRKCYCSNVDWRGYKLSCPYKGHIDTDHHRNK